MSLHKLTAGDGYQYLIRQTAAADRALEGREALSDYYSEKGEAPGSWAGSALASLGTHRALHPGAQAAAAERAATSTAAPRLGAGRRAKDMELIAAGLQANGEVTPGSMVSAEQMRALFGEGRHPNADEIEARVAALGGAPAVQAHASKLGSKYRTTGPEQREFLIECARAYEAYNRAADLPATAAVPEDERTAIRTRAGRELFTEQHGRPPADARELSGFIARESRPRQQACAGFDLTFSPVKSVSTLWALADRDTAKVIEQAHEAAVRDTIAWLERDVIYTRRGADGARTVDTNGVLAAMFVHRDSRAGDPDLHTHVAIANKVQDPTDGSWLAIDGQVLYKHTVAASERYNTRLEAELAARLGVEFEAADSPREQDRVVREIVGVPEELRQRWSARRVAIDAQLKVLTADFQARQGRVPSPKEALALAQQANLETRQAKHEHRSEAEQREQWATEAAETLGGPGAVQQLLDRVLNTSATQAVSPGELPAAERIEEMAERVLGRVEATRATFQRAHVRAEAERVVRTEGLATALAAGLPEGQNRAAVDLVDLVVEDITRHALAGSDTVELDATGIYKTPDQETIEPAALRRRDGSSQYETPGARLYTTSRVMSAEAFLLEAAQGPTTGHRGRRASLVDVAVGLLTETANGVDLNAGQQRLVGALATSGADLQLALAPAGSGKTTAMRALATAWRASGGHVLALAPSAVAATELGAATGSTAETLAKITYDLSEGLTEVTDTIDERTMIVIDEAGMASTPDLATVVALARQRGAVVRIIGDDQQLAAIGSGGVLRDIASRVGAVTLSDIVRFSSPGEAAAGLALRDGNATEALGFYLDNSRVRAASHLSGADDVFEAWAAARGAGQSALMLAADNETVNALNARARHHRLSAATPIAERRHTPSGPDAERTVTLRTGLQASAGDTVVTRMNSRKLRMTRTDHVKNGDRWTVVQAHTDGALTVRHDQLARLIKLPADYVADHVDLGYATTVHGAQGQTVDRSYALITSAWDRASAYVALTRGRHENVAFVATGGDGDPHTQITPEQIEQPTATETLLRVFERDASSVSATTAADQAAAPATQLRQLTAIYRDGVGRSAELLAGPQARQRITEQVEDLVPGISTTPSWDALLQHLCVLHLEHTASTEKPTEATGATGTDPAAADVSAAVDAFAAALSQRPLENANLTAAAETMAARNGVRGPTPARDLAAVMMWRLVPERRAQDPSDPANPLPWLQPLAAVIASDETYGPWLATRATQLREAEHQVRQDATSWTLATAPAWAQPLLQAHADRHNDQHDERHEDRGTDQAMGLVADLAVWRAAHGIEDADLRPAGPAPTSRLDRAHHRRLQRRVKDAGITDAAASSAATHWATAVQVLLEDHPADAHLTNDTWWPLLAARLDDLANGGLDLDHPDVLAALTDLAASTTEAPASTEALESTEAPVATELGEAAGRNLGRGGGRDEHPVDTDSSESPLPGPIPDTATEPENEPEKEPEVSRERIVQMHADAAAFYAAQVESSWVGDYLRGRGLGELLDAGRCGYAPRGPRVLLEHLTTRGYNPKELLAAGLATQGRHGLVDRFRDRMLFTIHDLDGHGGAEPVGFAGRAPEGSVAPKYLNTPTTEAFHKSQVLYGLAENAELLRAGAIPVIVEGQADAEAVTLATGGTHIGLAPGGTALTPDQVAALASVVDLANTPVVVATDNDAAGVKAANKAWGLLLQAGATDPRGLNLTHDDPADVVRYDGNHALADALDQTPPLVASIVATHLESWKPVLDHLDGQLGAVRAIAADVAQASPEQQVHATTLVQIAVDLDADIITDEFDQARGAEPAAPDDNQANADLDQVADNVAADEVDEVLRDDQLVEQLLAQALAHPLPDEHAAAALWSRLSPYTARTTATGATADRQLLAAGLEVGQAAQVMSTEAWPAIAEHVSEDLRGGRFATLISAVEHLADTADSTRPYASVDAYGAALLDRLAEGRSQLRDPDTATSSSAARERLLARTRATREASKTRLEANRRERLRREEADRRRRDAGPGVGPTPRP